MNNQDRITRQKWSRIYKSKGRQTMLIAFAIFALLGLATKMNVQISLFVSHYIETEQIRIWICAFYVLFSVLAIIGFGITSFENYAHSNRLRD